MATPADLKPTVIQDDKLSRTTRKRRFAAKEEFSAPPVLRRKPLLAFVQRERTRHGKVVYYFRRFAGERRIRLPDQYGSPEFIAAYQQAMATGEPPERLKIKEPKVLPRGQIGKALLTSLSAAKQRARERGMPFDLDYEWAVEQVEAQGLACALTGIKFFSKWEGPETQRNPTIPSIDRIVPSQGYIKSNCRIVTVAAIRAMIRASDETPSRKDA